MISISTKKKKKKKMTSRQAHAGEGRLSFPAHQQAAPQDYAAP